MSAPTVSRFRRSLVLLLAGPVLWFGHFMLVYLVAEAVCAAGGARLLGAPAITVVSLAATAVAVAATLLVARACARVWRGGQDRDELAFIGLLLALLSAVAILFEGLPPAFLPPC